MLNLCSGPEGDTVCQNCTAECPAGFFVSGVSQSMHENFESCVDVDAIIMDVVCFVWILCLDIVDATKCESLAALRRHVRNVPRDSDLVKVSDITPRAQCL